MPPTDAEFFDLIQRQDVTAALAALHERPDLCRARDTHLDSTPLHFAAHRGLTDVVGALLAAGADVHALEGASQSTALHWAAEGGHVAIVDRLLARGAELEPRDDWHRLTPLGWATIVDWAPPYREDRPGTIARLLAAGARLDPFTAIALGRSDALRAMAARDATVIRERLGYVDWEMTPLHVAAAANLTGAATLLLELGADPMARTSTGLTSLAVARQRGHEAVMAVLAPSDAAPEVSTAVAAGDPDEVAGCLRNTALPPDDVLSRLLFVAADAPHAHVATALLRAGANPNVEIRHLAGEQPALLTPLQFAARKGRAEVARALLDAGADPNAGRSAGLPTPLHFAAGEGHLDIVRILVAAGADQSSRDSTFHATAAGWAEFADHPDVVVLLRA